MKQNIRPLISHILLIVYLSFLALSCAYQNENPASAVVQRINKRLYHKDFILKNDKVENPFHSKGKAASDMFSYMSKKFDSNFKFDRIELEKFFDRRSSFQLAVNSDFYSESKSMGIDNPDTYDVALNEFVIYFDGIEAPETIEQLLSEANSLYLNYPPTYVGAQQFFDDCETSGKLTTQQSMIIQTLLNALLDANTKENALAINSMVEQEVLNSQMSSDEQSVLLFTTALVENILINDTIITSASDTDICDGAVFHKVGMASWDVWAGAALAIAGMVVLVIGSPILGAGLFGFGFGLFID